MYHPGPADLYSFRAHNLRRRISNSSSRFLTNSIDYQICICEPHKKLLVLSAYSFLNSKSTPVQQTQYLSTIRVVPQYKQHIQCLSRTHHLPPKHQILGTLYKQLDQLDQAPTLVRPSPRALYLETSSDPPITRSSSGPS